MSVILILKSQLCDDLNLYFFPAQDLEGKNMVDELKPDVISQNSNTNSKAEAPQCLSMAWSADGQTLFAGYSDNKIRVWMVSVSSRA